MAESEIPEDVMETAKSIARRREWVHEAIAEAILGERERCAQIALSVDMYDGDRLKNSNPRETIAAAIRQEPSK